MTLSIFFLCLLANSLRVGRIPLLSQGTLSGPHPALCQKLIQRVIRPSDSLLPEPLRTLRWSGVLCVAPSYRHCWGATSQAGVVFKHSLFYLRYCSVSLSGGPNHYWSPLPNTTWAPLLFSIALFWGFLVGCKSPMILRGSSWPPSPFLFLPSHAVLCCAVGVGLPTLCLLSPLCAPCSHHFRSAGFSSGIFCSLATSLIRYWEQGDRTSLDCSHLFSCF